MNVIFILGDHSHHPADEFLMQMELEMSDPRESEPIGEPGTPGSPRDPIPEDEDKGDPEGEDA